MFMDTEEGRFFKRKVNRFCVNFEGYGFVPVASANDDVPIFVSAVPTKIGDEAIIFAEGKHRLVRLMRSKGHLHDALYLVDMGKAKKKTQAA